MAKHACGVNIHHFKGEFLAQNVFLTEDAAFSDNARAFDSGVRPRL